MTAAVPGPSFRDQLAEALRSEAHWCEDGSCLHADDQPIIWSTTEHAGRVVEIEADPDVIVAFLLPLIAAEVEARVQAAANQRAEAGVTPGEIARQRTLGWPDFHPEDYCHQCGRPNPNWFADTEAWQLATESTGDGGGILCPSCFTTRWEAKTGLTAIVWRLSIGAGRDAHIAAALASPAPAPHAEEGQR